MKYMLQVRFNGADTVIGRLSAEEQQNVRAEFEAIRQSAGVLDSNQLQAASTAAIVRVDGGQTQVTESPQSRPEPSSTATTSTTHQTSTRRSRSRHESPPP